jgi:hypothetical protein
MVRPLNSLIANLHLSDTLFWCTTDTLPQNLPQSIVAFSTDRDLVYEAFNADFGPLDLGCLTRYCRALEHKVKQMRSPGTICVHFSNSNPAKRTTSFIHSTSFNRNQFSDFGAELPRCRESVDSGIGVV